MARKKAPARRKATVHTPSSTAKVILAACILLLLLGLLAFRFQYMKPSPKSTETTVTRETMFDFDNQPIHLDGGEFTLSNGTYNHTDPEMGTHTAEIRQKSINPLGTRAAAILIDAPGGSGVFVYVIGAMQENGKQIFSQPVLLGDRVKIVSVTVLDPEAEDNGEIVVEYLDRPADAAMAVDPTIPQTARFSFQDDGNLIQALN